MKALVVGGGGFLGTRIAEMLRDRGDDVVALGRNRYAHLEAANIRTVQADVRDATAIAHACQGMDVVFHVAALASIWGPRQSFWDMNVRGTQNVIDGCQDQGVSRLVFTSSPSVVFGKDALRGVDESVPYPDRYLAHYPETKAVAERLVLDADGPNLKTVALRPHLIWGPGDPHLIPRVIDRARRGQLVQVGDGKNLVDITFIDNAAEAHLLAADELSKAGRCRGQSYFISQGEPVELWSWLAEILSSVGAPAVKRTISYQMAWRVGAVLEFAYRGLGLRREPRMTRFLASQLAKSHYFDISAACRDFGYVPRISTEEGVRRFLAHLRDSRGESAGHVTD